MTRSGDLPAALANLAAAQSTLEQLPDALVTLDELEQVLAGGGAPELRTALYQNRGVVLRGLGRLEEALADLERAEAVAREAGRPGDVQAAAGERAGVLTQLGRRRRRWPPPPSSWRRRRRAARRRRGCGRS